MPTMYHPTIPNVTCDVDNVEEAAEQGWLEQPPAADDLATVEVETGPDETPRPIGTKAGKDADKTTSDKPAPVPPAA